MRGRETNSVGHLLSGFKEGEEGYIRPMLSSDRGNGYEFLMNAPIIWVFGRALWLVIFILPMICLCSLIAKLQGKHVEETKEGWTWVK